MCSISTELLEVGSYTILRFSVDADFEREPSLVVANYLLHLQAVVCKTAFSIYLEEFVIYR